MREEKDYYDIVFVVLVYRNIEILYDFFKSLKLSFSYKVIIVNSYFDEATEKKCQQIASENDSVFISVPNKGYSFGNNCGCDYALEHYSYKFLVISNSDIIINDLTSLSDIKQPLAVIAPETKMANGHRQNPHIPFGINIYFTLIGIAYKYDIPFIKMIALAINRFFRELMFLYMKLLNKTRCRVFSPHGSFIIFTYGASCMLQPIFNPKMFLYNEETFLGYKCLKYGIPVVFIPKIKITHLEGASQTKQSDSWRNRKESFQELNNWLKK